MAKLAVQWKADLDRLNAFETTISRHSKEGMKRPIELNWIYFNNINTVLYALHRFVKNKTRTNIEIRTQLTCSVNTVIYLHDNL